VPTPHWVRTETLLIPDASISAAQEHIQRHLGPAGIEAVGGATWWAWRRPKQPLKSDWIEMRSDYNLRKSGGTADGGAGVGKGNCRRVMFYVHGGAYFFGSVDEHRYQMQRHARKLKARVFAPRYRLSPQFPFPCGLLDCLAAYIHLLSVQDPSTIVLAGDSAGGGMVVSLLVLIRDQGLPMPSGAVLISPWVDLTHSFPSVAETNEGDYIPPHGFMAKPSVSWPPLNADDLRMLDAETGRNRTGGIKMGVQKTNAKDANEGSTLRDVGTRNVEGEVANPVVLEHATSTTPPPSLPPSPPSNRRTTPPNLSITIDGTRISIKDQIQMYAPNHLLSHPLVSPVLQPSLGGLCALLILVGGGEMLRDEQIYLAHKAANPSSYTPNPIYYSQLGGEGGKEKVEREWKKHRPTFVQLQVWDDLCHVAPTLSFTRPAKYMYRSIAQFGAWALARAQKTDVEILDDDDVSVISSDTDTEPEDTDGDGSGRRIGMGSGRKKVKDLQSDRGRVCTAVGKAGDPLPAFKQHMIRQRVDRHGKIFPLADASSLPGCQMRPEDVGTIKAGPVRKWMAAMAQWDAKFAGTKRKVRKTRLREMKKGYRSFPVGKDGKPVEGVRREFPPPSALAGRFGLSEDSEALKVVKGKKSMGMAFWHSMASSHDKDAVSTIHHLVARAVVGALVVPTTERRPYLY